MAVALTKVAVTLPVTSVETAAGIRASETPDNMNPFPLRYVADV